MRKVVFSVLVAIACCSLVFAGGSSESTSSSSQRVVTTTCRASYANEEWYNEMNAAFEAETGIHVEVQPTPGNDEDHDALLNTWLMAGDTIDVIPSLGPKFYTDRVEAGFFMDLLPLFDQRGVDIKSIYGSYLQIEADGGAYSVPTKQELYCCFYNKDLFDKAGLDYPNGSWTWDEYVETARKLSDPKNGIYGSYMNAENPWTIIMAKQKDVPLYKEDGTSNIEAQEFIEAIEWFKALGDEGVQMPYSEMLNENVSWNYYAIGGDRLAMFIQGNWFTRLLNSQADYPRDWKYGVTTVPANPDGNNNLVSMAYMSINKNAEHLEEAIEYVKWLGENEWRYEGGIPALATLSEEDQNSVFAGIADASNGQVTVAELYTNWIDTGLGVSQSDIVGVAANEYNRIANAEIQAYLLDLQDIDTTISNIVSKANEAIKNSN